MRARARPPACTRTRTSRQHTHTERHAQPRANSRVRKTPEYFFLATFKSRLVLFTSFFSGGGGEEGKEGMGGVASSRSGECACARVFFINHMPLPPPPAPRRNAQRPPYALFLEVADPLARSLFCAQRPAEDRVLRLFFFLTPSTERAPVLSRSTKWVNNN